jgi:hypothetical protein
MIRANEKKIAWIILAMILGQYSFQLIQEWNDTETYEDYAMYLIPFYERCTLTKFEHFEENNGGIYRNSLKSWLNCLGYQAFTNDRILPSLFSLGCVYLVYLLGHSMSKDRIVGLIAASALMTSPLLTKFDTSPTYDQAWAFFFLLSMVLLYRMPKASPLVYPLAIFSKVYSIAFIPMYAYTAYKNGRDLRWILGGVIILGFVGSVIALTLGVGTPLGFHPERFTESGLRIFEVLWPVLPVFALFFGLDVIFKGRYNESRNLVLLWLFGIMMTIPVVYVFSNQWMFGYRFVPFAAFLGIYVGMTMTKLGSIFLQYKLRVPNHKTQS